MIFSAASLLRSGQQGSLSLIFGVIAMCALATPAQAQSTEMDRCTSIETCDDVATDFIGKSALLLESDLYVEAAQHLYPVLLTNRVSPLIQTATRDQFSAILATAGLFELAAEQKDLANWTTQAPSSSGLLERARLLAQVGDMRDEMLAAYEDASALALASANLATLDAIISDYATLGEGARARVLEGQRVGAAARAQTACAVARCNSRPLIDAKAVKSAVPVYPPRALNAGDEAECRVRLNVTEAGVPVDIAPECTDEQFIESASQAALETEFHPRYRNGRPEPRYNVILPFSYATTQ